MADRTDKAVNKLAVGFERIRSAIMRVSLNVINQEPTLEEIAAFPLESLIMQELGGASMVQAVGEVAQGLANAKNPNLQAALGQMDEQFFIRELGKAASEAKKVIMDAFLYEYDTKRLKELLEQSLSNLTEQKIGSLLNTAIRTTERTAYAVLVNDLPDETLFEYVGGPLIDTSRPFCREWYGKTITLGKLKELLNDDGEPAISAAGGYNCRHSFEEVQK